MKDVIAALEEIERSVKGVADISKIEKSIQSAKSKLTSPNAAHKALLNQLQEELSIWQKKLNVILKEPAGREGMAKHAKHWVEELRKLNGG